MAYRRLNRRAPGQNILKQYEIDLLEQRLLLSGISFAPQATSPTGQTPSAVAVADLGNGHPDLVLTNQGSNTVSVLLGNGDGTFQSQQSYATGTVPISVAVADLGNGHPDIVVGNYSSNTVSVLLGNGDGTFQPQQTYATGNVPISVAIADLGNGHPDLVVANEGSNTVSVLLGNGDGTFQPQQTYATGSSPDSVAIADLGNGRPDLVVANYASNTVSVLLGNGDGTFQPQATYATGDEPYSVAVADLGNGHADIAVADFNQNTVSVLLGNGDGTFQAQQTYTTGDAPDAVAIADLGNGQPDLIVANADDATVSVLQGNGDGIFQAQQTFPTGNGPIALAVANLGNGYPDIVIANEGSNTVSVLLGRAYGSVNTNGLVPVISKASLPEFVVGAAAIHGSATVKLTNSLTTSESGASTIDIYASTDGQIDSSSILIGHASPKLTIKAGLSKLTLVAVKASSLPQGTYTILAQATDPAGNVVVSTTGPSLTVVAPYVSLAETITPIDLTGDVISGEKTHASAKVQLANSGDIASKGTVTIALSASTDPDVAGTPIVSITRKLTIAPEDGKATVQIPFKDLPALVAGDYYIIASVTDPLGGTSLGASTQAYPIAAPSA